MISALLHTYLMGLYWLVGYLLPTSPVLGFVPRVIAHSDKNRMTAHNLGIVFGPTLFRPEQETSDMTAHVFYPGQLIQLMLNNFASLFT